MKNIAIVNLINISDYFYMDILGESQLERLKRYSISLTGVEKTIFLVSSPLEGVENQVLNTNWSQELLIETFSKECKGFDHLFYFHGDCPLLDSELSNQMYSDHISYYAEYTFADGYPYGLTPEIIDVSIIEPLKILAKGSSEPVDRDSIFEIVRKDINSFELETTIAPKDQRLLRISLTSDSKRNFNQLKRIIDRGGLDAKTVPETLVKNPEDLLLEPSFVTIEIANTRTQDVNYLPKRTGEGEVLTLDNLNIILDKIKNYSSDCTISFVPEYEPTTHPQLIEIIRSITARGFDLFIETSGLGWSQELVNEFKANQRVKVIVTLDAITPEVYRELRGQGMEEAYALGKHLIDLCKDRVWVQAIRMKSNEGDMEQFYRSWQEFTPNIIVQKYSNYCGTLPDLKLADLSPLKRFPCWHIKRDLHIAVNGDVPLCPFDLKGEHSLGNLLNDTIESIQSRKLDYYKKHIKEDYPKLCRSCDEYYTFNF